MPAYIFLHHSRWGRYLFAVGSNAEAARLSGVNVQRTIYMAYIAVGAVRGLRRRAAGLAHRHRQRRRRPKAGSCRRSPPRSSAAPSLFGAVGSVHGPLLGAFILATINNGANLLNVNSFWQRIITGVLIIVIVYFDGLRRRGK